MKLLLCFSMLIAGNLNAASITSRIEIDESAKRYRVIVVSDKDSKARISTRSFSAPQKQFPPIGALIYIKKLNGTSLCETDGPITPNVEISDLRAIRGEHQKPCVFTVSKANNWGSEWFEINNLFNGAFRCLNLDDSHGMKFLVKLEFTIKTKKEAIKSTTDWFEYTYDEVDK